MNAINWTQKAAKQLRKLDRQHQVAIRDGVSTLAAMPDCQSVKALADHEYGYASAITRSCSTGTALSRLSRLRK
ncbi:hypothetical protein PQQ63_37420 [Paraburkholderia metrosideri]|uniref:Uncharacterized protein n=1 Tax=Paraburkholderia metrosideri TaxID=580937 RepID=A0ABW9E8E1_9BURK